MNKKKAFAEFWAFVIVLCVCGHQQPDAWALEFVQGPNLTVDSESAAPNTAVIDLTTDEPTRVTVSVIDDEGTFYVEFPAFQTDHAVPLLGFKADSSYVINVMATNQLGQSLHAAGSLSVDTPPLPAEFPTVDLLSSSPNQMEPGLTLLDRFSRGRGVNGPVYSMIVDSFGEVVWYSTLGSNAMKQLPSGNLRYRTGDSFTEINLLGQTQQTIQLLDPGLGLHHDLVETAHGTFLSLSRATVSVPNFPTSETDPNAPVATADVRDEPVVEFLADGSVLHNWPLIDVLEPTRIGYDALISTNAGFDWAHTNAIIHDQSDDSVIVSVRHQDAVIKMSRTNGSLIWILANPNGWSPFYQQFLLQPVGTPFIWQYHQHAPMLTPQGTLLLYDNGSHRATPFDGTTPLTSTETYSGVIEYEIDEENMTVSMVGEYGSQVPNKVFSGTRGDADWLPITDNILITHSDISIDNGTSSADLGLGERHVRIVEITNSPSPVVFDLRIHDPAGGRIGIYRSERIPGLYPASVEITGPFPPAEVETSWAANDICFEFDNDGDGVFSEDGGAALVDDDGDGLVDEDAAECPGGTSGGSRLPDDGNQNYRLETGPDGFNVNELYLITSFRIHENADTLGIGSFYDTCDNSLDLNVSSNDYVAMIVAEHPDGTLQLIHNANISDPNLTGQLNEQAATLQWLREFHPGEIVHLYLDFSLASEDSGYCYAYAGGGLASGGQPSANSFNYAGLVVGPP